MIITATNIEYDTDGEVIEGLPTELSFELDEAYFSPEDGDLSDLISDEVGYCVKSLHYTIS